MSKDIMEGVNMTKLTIIESKKLDELLEKAILYDMVEEEYRFVQNNPDINKQIMIRKANFLSDYVDVTFDLEEQAAKLLEDKFDK